MLLVMWILTAMALRNHQLLIVVLASLVCPFRSERIIVGGFDKEDKRLIKYRVYLTATEREDLLKVVI